MLMELAFNDFLVNNQVDKVLLSASWKDEDLPNLSATLDTLKSRGIDVIVLGPIVEYDAPLPRLLIDGILRDSPSLASTQAHARNSGARSRHERLGKGAAARPISPSTMRFAGTAVATNSPKRDIPMQFDAGHLTAKGAAEVGRRLVGSSSATNWRGRLMFRTDRAAPRRRVGLRRLVFFLVAFVLSLLLLARVDTNAAPRVNSESCESSPARSSIGVPLGASTRCRPGKNG